jgi:hypothetical protein
MLDYRTIRDGRDRHDASWSRALFALRPGRLVELSDADLATPVATVPLAGAQCQLLPRDAAAGRAHCFELSAHAFRHFFQFAATGSSDAAAWQRYLAAQIGLLAVNAKIEAVEQLIMAGETQATEAALAREFGPAP